MPCDPFKYHRRSIRLHGYDYTQAGAYFVTIVACNRECLFGEVVGGEMRVNACREIVVACWDTLPEHFSAVELDAFVVMPNHVHGIIVIGGEGVDQGKGEAFSAELSAEKASPLQPHGTIPGSVGAIIQNFKSVSTRKINQLRDITGVPVWHRNYFEHIIRNEKSLNAIRAYTVGNSANWAHDKENPSRV